MLWKFTEIRESWLMSWRAVDELWGFGGTEGDDELSCFGSKGFGLWTESEIELALDRYEEECEEKKLEWNCGKPHWGQCQEASELSSAWYICVFMPRHFLWCQPSQSSHWTAGVFHVQALLHIQHGYLGVLGPGFDSMSRAANSAVHLRSDVFKLCVRECAFLLFAWLVWRLTMSLWAWLQNIL